MSLADKLTITGVSLYLLYWVGQLNVYGSLGGFDKSHELVKLKSENARLSELINIPNNQNTSLLDSLIINDLKVSSLDEELSDIDSTSCQSWLYFLKKTD